MSDTQFGNYILGLAGLSMIRRWYDSATHEHRQTLLDLTADYEANGVLNFAFDTPEHEPQAGYTIWAENYDGPNPMVAAEEAVVVTKLRDLYQPGMTALDAGCGTGRHAATLSELGYDVIGTDLTPAMLEVASDKVPDAEFRVGAFEDLPLDNDSVDLITSALAVCHAQDLDVVFAEFARVLRPGGRIVISDPHPTSGHLGGQAFFNPESDSNDIPFVRNRSHQMQDYVNAMLSAGFRIDGLIELPYDEAVVSSNPGFALYPDVMKNALIGLPFVVIWEATLA